MDYFISDTHFGHKNILTYDGRPYKDTAEMDAALTENWNKAVGKDDDVWILGDVIWTKNPKIAEETLGYLNGKKHLITGNHDQVFQKNAKYFLENGLLVEMTPYKELQIPHVAGKIILSHFPLVTFNGQLHGWFHFYGHVHNSSQWHMVDYIRKQSEQIYQCPCQMINVGCMMPWMDYTPRSFECLCAAMEDEGFRKPGQRSAAEAEKQEDQKSQKSEQEAIRELRREHVRRGDSIRERKTVKSVQKKTKGE